MGVAAAVEADDGENDEAVGKAVGKTGGGGGGGGGEGGEGPVVTATPPAAPATVAEEEDAAEEEDGLAPPVLGFTMERSWARAAAAVAREEDGSGKAETARLRRRAECPSIADGS